MSLYRDQQDEEIRPEPGDRERCNPERLLAFINETIKATGKQPTLLDLKHKFGGILGPMVDFWKLKEQGKL